MIDDWSETYPVTVVAEKFCGMQDIVAVLRRFKVVQHVTQSDIDWRSAIDGHTARHTSYALSQRVCKHLEEIFGWGKQIVAIHTIKFRGKCKLSFLMLLIFAG